MTRNKEAALMYLLLSIFATVGHAQTLGTVDWTTPMKDVSGKVMRDGAGRIAEEAQKDPKCEQCKAVTVGQVVANCLAGDDKLPPEKKAAAWRLATRVYDNPADSVTTPEWSLIEGCADKLSPLAVGQVKALDPNYKPAPLQ